IKGGDCIAMLSPPRPEAMITFFAAARLGAVWVGLNPRYRIRELAYVIGHARPALIVSIGGFEERDYVSDLDAAMADVSDTTSRSTTIFFDGNADSPGALIASLDKAAGSAQPDISRIDVDPAAPSMLVYTSGTT